MLPFCGVWRGFVEGFDLGQAAIEQFGAYEFGVTAFALAIIRGISDVYPAIFGIIGGAGLCPDKPP